MEENLINKIKDFTKKLGEVYAIFTDNKGNYAVTFKDQSETMVVFDDSFDYLEFCKAYDNEGGNICANWDIVYEDKKFDEENEEDNVD